MDNKKESAKKLGATSLLFASGVALDCLAHATTTLTEDATLLGLSPHVVGGILTLGSHVMAHGVFEGWQKTQEHFKGDLNSDLEHTIINSYHKTFADIKTEILSEFKLNESKKEWAFRYFFNKENESSLFIESLDSEFLYPLKDSLLNNDNIEQMLSNNEQLHPDEYLLKIIENATPEYFNSKEKGKSFLASIVLEKFKRLYRHHFLQELKPNERAKTVYFTHLLESILRKTEKIYQNTEDTQKGLQLLNDFASEANLNLSQILINLKKLDEIKGSTSEIKSDTAEILSKVNTLVAYVDILISRSNQEKIYTRIDTTERKIKFQFYHELVIRDNLSCETLKYFLEKGDFKSADRETIKIFSTAINEFNKVFDQKLILNFPCEKFREIDNLWLEYSNGKFGFSAQGKIWNRLGDKDSFYIKAEKFADIVGWKVNGSWLKNSDLLSFSQSATEGHLPSFTLSEYGNTEKWLSSWINNIKSLTTKYRTCLHT